MSRWIEIDTSLLKTISVGGLSAKALWKRIMQQPSIDIVRCKECYMCDEEMWCSFYDSIMESDDYCSYGERKDNGKDIQSATE